MKKDTIDIFETLSEIFKPPTEKELKELSGTDPAKKNTKKAQ